MLRTGMEGPLSQRNMSIEHVTRKINRLRRVAQHIDRHLFDPLRLDDLADVASMSRFHFERVFADYAGETPLARVRRLRLQLARRLLLRGDARSILDLALTCGYNSAEAFARAFRAQFGQTPSALRAAGTAPKRPPLEICHLPPLAIQYISYRGPMDESLQPFDELRARALHLGIARDRRKGWAVHLEGGSERWDAPNVDLQAALLSERLGTRIPGIDHGHLPENDYAVFQIEGGYDAPPRAELTRRVASETGWQVCDGPVLRRFDNTAYLPAPHERKFQLFLPVRR